MSVDSSPRRWHSGGRTRTRFGAPGAWLLLAVLTLGACGDGGGSAPVDPAALRGGSVTLTLVPSGLRVAGVDVVLSQGGEVHRATTGGDGVAHLDPVLPGTYVLALEGLPRRVVGVGLPESLTFDVANDRDIELFLGLDIAPGPLLLYGDSDTDDQPPFEECLADHLEREPALAELLGFPVTVVNRSSPQVTVARDQEGSAFAGVDVVPSTLSFHPDATLVLLRYGRDDLHAYLLDPTPEALAIFEGAYRELILGLLDANRIPVLATLSREANRARAEGESAINDALEALAAEFDLPIVVSDLDAGRDPDLFEEDGVHHATEGHRRVAGLTAAALVGYFTGTD